MAIVVVVASFLGLYWEVLSKLVHDWATDDNYSHGFIIAPLAAYFAYERRAELLRATRQPSVLGLILIVGSLGVLVAGRLGAELFLTRISMIGLLIGTIVFAWGWRHARVLAFPVAFLLLMIPIPAIVFNQVAFPLQLWASQFGEWALELARIPVLREGNVIILPNITLEVAEACSGIRSLVSLVTLALVLSYFSESRIWARVVITCAAVPVAIFANALRVAGTGIAARSYGEAAAEGFMHTFSGWLVFVVSFAMLFALQHALTAITRLAAPAPEVQRA